MVRRQERLRNAAIGQIIGNRIGGALSNPNALFVSPRGGDSSRQTSENNQLTQSGGV